MFEKKKQYWILAMVFGGPEGGGGGEGRRTQKNGYICLQYAVVQDLKVYTFKCQQLVDTEAITVSMVVFV